MKPINLAKLKEDDLNKKTALVKRCFNCEHRIDFGNFEILGYNIDYDKRKFLESLYINNTKNSINDKDRNVFPKIYSNIKKISTNVGFQPVKFVSFALSNYEIVLYVRFSPCVCWFVFLTFWFLNTVRVVFCFYLKKSARCNGRIVVEFFFNKYYAFCIC